MLHSLNWNVLNTLRVHRQVKWQVKGATVRLCVFILVARIIKMEIALLAPEEVNKPFWDERRRVHDVLSGRTERWDIYHRVKNLTHSAVTLRSFSASYSEGVQLVKLRMVTVISRTAQFKGPCPSIFDSSPLAEFLASGVVWTSQHLQRRIYWQLRAWFQVWQQRAAKEFTQVTVLEQVSIVAAIASVL